MALLQTEFIKAIEDFASKWQESLDVRARHEDGDWEHVRVVEMVCFLGLRYSFNIAHRPMD